MEECNELCREERMAAKEVKFSVEARDKMLHGIDILAHKSHRTNARLSGYSDRRVCGVAGMLPGGARRREECWNHFALPAQRRSGLGGPRDDAA
jgi:hypothetical protein